MCRSGAGNCDDGEVLERGGNDDEAAGDYSLAISGGSNAPLSEVN
jgi:hypothetical protein